jgi:hypothetical protein
MQPRNGEYFTFRVSDVHDDELSNKRMIRAVTLGWQHWTKRADIVMKKAKPDETPDFRVIFRTPNTDERGELTDRTIMYHYFPINDVSHELRGLCVVNSPDNYDEGDTATGRTIDIDQVFTHEFGHGIGLPHDPTAQNVMSSSYGFMAEFPTERDIFRAVSKYGVPKKKPSWFSRWYRYLRHRSDNY